MVLLWYLKCLGGCQTAPLDRSPPTATLTPIESEVVEWAGHGLPSTAIADKMDISTDAVKHHLASALNKLGLMGSEEIG